MLKIGIAGYGKRMQSLIKLLTEMEDCRVVAVADPQQPEETALQKIQNPQVRWYGELEEMLKKEPLDGLFIGTRCSLHTPMALTAARYNLPLFLEKPVCINQEQLNLLQGILPQMESKTVVSFPLRSCALVKTVKEIVENGTLGTLSQVHAFNNVPYGRGYYHKWYRERAGNRRSFSAESNARSGLYSFLTATGTAPAPNGGFFQANFQRRSPGRIKMPRLFGAAQLHRKRLERQTK